MAETGIPSVWRCACPDCERDPQGNLAAQHRALNTLVASLDERSRRLVVGLLAKRQGRGGVTHLARITGLSRNTIRRGQQELARPVPLPLDRVRRPGAGRKRVEKKTSRGRGRPGGAVA
jgi:DNA-binding phage protein